MAMLMGQGAWAQIMPQPAEKVNKLSWNISDLLLLVRKTG